MDSDLKVKVIREMAKDLSHNDALAAVEAVIYHVASEVGGKDGKSVSDAVLTRLVHTVEALQKINNTLRGQQ